MRMPLKVITGHLCAYTLIILATVALALFVVRAETTIRYGFVDRGGVSLITRGGTSSVIMGYARIQPDASNTTPSGLAIFGYRPGSVLVSEAGVPASTLIRSGRIYLESNGPVKTGIAIANPGSQPAAIQFSFTNSAGVDLGQGNTTLPANSQFAGFLDQTPFNAGNSVTGTFTFSSSTPVAVIALRGLTNEQGEFLITTLPVIDLAAPSSGSTILPHFADGNGWTTQVILVNPSDSPTSGSVQFFSQGTPAVAGQPLSITVNGQTGTIFNYTVERRSSIRLQTSGASSDLLSGTVHMTPSLNQAEPAAFVIFSHKSGPNTVSEASVPALRPTSALRIYVEASGEPSLIRTGIAVANPSSTPITANFEVTGLAGGSPILAATATIPANGQIAKFIDEIPGLESLPRPFKGVLRAVTASAGGITAIGLRTRTNERRDLLITTTPPVDETVPASQAEAFFPHFVDNGGYTTQFILYSGSAEQQSTGQIRLIGQNGQPLDLGFTSFADLAVTQTISPNPVIAGSTVSFAISVTNNGPAEATSVQMTDVLPSGIPLERTSVTQGVCTTPSGGTFICNFGRLAVGATAGVNVVVRPPTPATLVNTVAVSAMEDDASWANNRNVASSAAGVSADLELKQTGSGTCSGNATCNPRPQYHITVQNKGPSPAPNVTVTDILPTDLYSPLVVGAVLPPITVSQGSCSPTVAGTFSCSLGLLPVGAIAKIDLTLDIDITIIGRKFVNSASVASKDVVDPITANNSEEVTTAWIDGPRSLLEILQITAMPSSVTAGNSVTLNISFQNDGPSTATNLKVTTTGLTGVKSATSTQGACSIGTTSVVCNIGNLVRNSPRNITILFFPTTSGSVTAEIRSSEGDPKTKSVSVVVK